MRLSHSILLLAPALLAIPIPATYTWSFTSWSSGWYGIGWANFLVSAPATTVSGVTIPALSLTDICHIANQGGQTQNCNDLIAGDKKGRTLEFTLRPFDASLQQVQLDGVYTFVEGTSTYAVDASISRDPQAKTDVTINPTTLRKVS